MATEGQFGSGQHWGMLPYRLDWDWDGDRGSLSVVDVRGETFISQMFVCQETCSQTGGLDGVEDSIYRASDKYKGKNPTTEHSSHSNQNRLCFPMTCWRQRGRARSLSWPARVV